MHESSPVLFEKTYATNTLGPMLLASRCAERMRDAGGGVIINVVTTGAFRPGAGLGLYCSSKAALHALTLVMAKEWAAWGVRVNEIAPGPFLTDMMAPGAANPEFTARMFDSCSSSGLPIRRRSSVPRCSSRAMRRASRPARP